MKKIFFSFAICLCVLLSGLVLSACGGGTHQISFEMDASLVSAKVIADGTEIEGDINGNFRVLDKSNVRIEFRAKKYGVDFSEVEILLNDESVTLKTFGTSYDALDESDDYVGYVLIARISNDVRVKMAGEKVLSSTFDFEVENADDEIVKKKMKSMQVQISGDEFANFFQFMDEGKKLVREVDNVSGIDSKSRVLTMKFAPNNLYKTGALSLVKIKRDNGDVLPAQSVTTSGNEWKFDLGDFEYEGHYTIMLDFDSLQYRKYKLNLPKDDFAYSISTNCETIDYASEGEVTLTKLMNETQANYSKVQVFLDETALAKTSEDAEKITFKIPSAITPDGGSDTYLISVQGIEFLKPAHSVAAFSAQQEEAFLRQIEHTLFIANENGEKVSDLGNVDGIQSALDGQKVALKWNLKDGFSYERYDYDVCLNGTKLFNLKNVLSVATSDFVDMKDAVCGGDNYTLRATYNDQTGEFESFQVEVTCTADVDFTFENFKTKNENV